MLLVCGLISNCDSVSNRATQVTLHGALFEPVKDGLRTSYFDAAHSPRWRFEPPLPGTPRLSLVNDAGQAQTLAVKVEIRDGFAIVRTATVALQGDFQAHLTLGDTLLWQGRLRWIPKWEHLPEIAAAKVLWEVAPARAEASLREQTQDPCPWKRYAAYRMWGRLAWSKSATSAHAIWSTGSRDVVVARAIPEGALTLGGSAAFVDSTSGNVGCGAEHISYLDGLLGHTRSGLHSANVLLNSAVFAILRRQHTRSVEFLRASLEMGWRTGEDGVWANSMMMVADQLVLLGRYGEAADILRQARSKVRGARNVSLLELNLIWAELWGHEAGVRPVPPGSLEPRLAELLLDLGEHGVLADRTNVRACLAYLALRTGDIDEAAGWLRDVPTWRPEDLGFERWFIRLVRAELLLRQDKLPEAQAELKLIVSGTRGEVGSIGPHEVLALALLGQVFEAQGDTSQAAQFAENAWRGSLEAARNLDLIGAHNHYLHLQRDLPLRLAKVRAQAGDLLGAAAVLEETHSERWVQMQAMGALENRPEMWGLVQDARTDLANARKEGCGQVPPKARKGCQSALETKARAARQAEMTFYAQLHLPRRADVQDELRTLQASLRVKQGVLLSAGRGPRQQAFLLTRDDILSASGNQALLALAVPLAALEALSVVGPLAPTAQISPDGQPWGARLQIHRQASATWKPNLPQAANRPVVVIADPKGDLQAVNAEGRALAKRFGINALVSTQATHSAVLEAFKTRPRLFVFSGHGQVEDLDHASTKLRLFDRDLEMQDVLTDRLAADVVVLNGCTTGSTHQGYGVGLPEAFVLQGSSAVLATIEALPEQDAHRFLTRFFDAGGDKTPGPAFQAAIIASVKAKDGIWRRYRLWR